MSQSLYWADKWKIISFFSFSTFHLSESLLKLSINKNYIDRHSTENWTKMKNSQESEKWVKNIMSTKKASKIRISEFSFIVGFKWKWMTQRMWKIIRSKDFSVWLMWYIFQNFRFHLLPLMTFLRQIKISQENFHPEKKTKAMLTKFLYNILLYFCTCFSYLMYLNIEETSRVFISTNFNFKQRSKTSEIGGSGNFLSLFPSQISQC